MDTGYGYIKCWQKDHDKIDTLTGELECQFPSFFHFPLPNANSGQQEAANDAATGLTKTEEEKAQVGFCSVFMDTGYG